MENPRNLSWTELEWLTEWFMYNLDMAQRQKLMAELPHIYNKYHGREIVQVVAIDNPDVKYVSKKLENR